MRSLLLLLFLGACGTSVGSKLAGETCHASSECGADLVCDFSKSPPICASMGQLPPDAAGPDAKPGTPDAKPAPDAKPVVIDAAVPDASLPDASLPDAM